MRVGSFRISDGDIIGPARFMVEHGRKIMLDLAGNGEVPVAAKKWGCSEQFALLIKLHEAYSDWYAAQRFADGFDRGIEFMTDRPQGDRINVPQVSLN